MLMPSNRPKEAVAFSCCFAIPFYVSLWFFMVIVFNALRKLSEKARHAFVSCVGVLWIVSGVSATEIGIHKPRVRSVLIIARGRFCVFQDSDPISHERVRHVQHVKRCSAEQLFVGGLKDLSPCHSLPQGRVHFGDFGDPWNLPYGFQSMLKLEISIDTENKICVNFWWLMSSKSCASSAVHLP